MWKLLLVHILTDPVQKIKAIWNSRGHLSSLRPSWAKAIGHRFTYVPTA